jgi:hypothetical protein
MARGIKNRYAALTRCLDLDGSVEQFDLTNLAVPVVLLCQLYEQETLSLRASPVAAVGSAATVALKAGTYDVAWGLTVVTNLATGNLSSVAVKDVAGGSERLRIGELYTGLVGEARANGRALVNVRDGEVIQLIVDAEGAGNSGNGFALIQGL